MAIFVERTGKLEDRLAHHKNLSHKYRQFRACNRLFRSIALFWYCYLFTRYVWCVRACARAPAHLCVCVCVCLNLCVKRKIMCVIYSIVKLIRPFPFAVWFVRMRQTIHIDSKMWINNASSVVYVFFFRVWIFIDNNRKIYFPMATAELYLGRVELMVTKRKTHASNIVLLRRKCQKPFILFIFVNCLLLFRIDHGSFKQLLPKAMEWKLLLRVHWECCCFW